MDKNIRERIKEIIQAKKMSNSQFAKILEVDHSHISKIISGQRMPSVRLIESICTKFDINREWLEYGEGERDKPKSQDCIIEEISRIYDESVVIRSILTVYAGLNKTNQEVFNDLVNKFIDEYNRQTNINSIEKDRKHINTFAFDIEADEQND